MNIRTTVILTVILALLGAYMYFFEYKGKQEQLRKETVEKQVLSLVRGNVSSFVYKNRLQNTEATFVRQDNRWVLNEPVRYRADEPTIDNLITTAFDARFDERVQNPRNLEEFGLKEPLINITFKTAAGEESFKVGDKSPTETSVYVMTDKSNDIFLVPVSTYYSLDKKLSDLRNKDILNYNQEKISFLRVDNTNGIFSLVKENNDWFLDLPNKLKADQEKVTELLDKIQQTKISDFVEDNPAGLTTFGLDKPVIKVSLGDNNDNPRHILLVGNETGDYNFAKNNEYNTVFKINKSFSEKFKDVNLMFFRNKTVVSFDKTKINRVEIESVGKKINAEKKDGKWEIPADAGLKAEDLDAFVDKLSNLTFERTFSRNDFSLGDKIINVTLYQAEGTDPVKLTFGGITSDNPDQVYLLNHSETQEAYAVNKSILDKIN